jgi:hypothetical protein
MKSESPTIESMIEDLKAEGWTAKTRTIWQAPTGKLFLGPYGAWKAMNEARRRGLWKDSFD